VKVVVAVLKFFADVFDAMCEVETWLVVVGVLALLLPGCACFDAPPRVSPELSAAVLSLQGEEMERAIREAQRMGPAR
jgi:hypothetical protein